MGIGSRLLLSSMPLGHFITLTCKNVCTVWPGAGLAASSNGQVSLTLVILVDL